MAFQGDIVGARQEPYMNGPVTRHRVRRSIRGERVCGGPTTGAPWDGVVRGEVSRMEPCICRGLPEVRERILLLECLECEGSLVRCW